MKKYFSVLKACPMFDGIVEEELEAMLACLGARVNKAKKGEAFDFTPNKGHDITATGKTGATLLWVSTPPSF